MPVVVVADAHLGGPGGSGEELADQLRALTPARCARVLFLGDLFHLWIGSRRFETPEVRLLAPVIQDLRRRGIRVSYVEGNRDFFLAGGAYDDLFDDYGHEIRFQAGGAKYLAVHGDGLNRRDWRYRCWRRSSPYVDTTLQVMADFGSSVGTGRGGEAREFRTEPHRPEAPGGRYRIAGDDSAAAYPAAAAAVCGGRVRLRGLAPTSTQGDREFLGLLEQMGVAVRMTPSQIEVEGDGRLQALDCDLSGMPDQVPTLAAVAAFARGVTTIRNVAHLRIKESDRLAAIGTELRRSGVPVEELKGGLRIEGNPALTAAPGSPRVAIDTYDDHRIAMSMALVGLRRGGLSIRRPAVVAKSYPGFWADLEGIAP